MDLHIGITMVCFFLPETLKTLLQVGKILRFLTLRVVRKLYLVDTCEGGGSKV